MMTFLAPLTAYVLNSHIAVNQKMKPITAFPPPFPPLPYTKKIILFPCMDLQDSFQYAINFQTNIWNQFQFTNPVTGRPPFFQIETGHFSHTSARKYIKCSLYLASPNSPLSLYTFESSLKPSVLYASINSVH